ncbi:MAG: ABC transporter permease subunit [Planctomycetota bacterium]|jgi:ABC-type transport system involved in multi-copper enzyme maturation permease subunit
MPHPWRAALGRGLVFALFLLVHLAVIIGFYPKFVEQQGALLAIAKGLGKVFSQTAEISTKSEWGYMVSQQFFKFSDTVGTFVAVLFAASAIASDASRRTLEIWLSQPIPRWRQVLERYVTGALSIVLPVVLTSMTAPAIGPMVGVEVSSTVSLWFQAGLHASAFLLVGYSLTFLISTRAEQVVRPVLGVALGGAAAYAMYFVPVLTDYSPFRFADAETFLAIESAGLDLKLFGGLVAINFALLAASIVSFQRRLPT